MNRLVMIAVALLFASEAQAQTPLQLNTTPTGAAVPSAQQTTGTTVNAPHGADRAQTPTGSPSANAAHSDEPVKGSVPGNAAPVGGATPNQAGR